jgi:hypothetical protein
MDRSTVASSGLITDGLSSRANCHSVTVISPTLGEGLAWLVMAITMRSSRSRCYAAELTTTAGRFLIVD